jgi:hypothetical protein
LALFNANSGGGGGQHNGARSQKGEDSLRAGRATDPTAAERPWQKRLRAFLGRASALGLAIGLALLLPFCPPAQAANPAEGPGPLEKLRPLIKTTSPDGHLQELPPPLAVQQIQAALADRQPRVTILAPADGTNLPNGNWTLKLLAQDWPLTDGGSLGLGPHVVIQIDDQEPIRLTEHRSTPQGDSLQLTLPALTPGSHRITTYAAKPWGEAAKNSGAASQIRVDRVAANPLTVPKPGSPQLLPVSPLGVVSSEPVLLDWLLLDAPLQHLRDNDGSWRLRVSVNGDSFITDQNVPIWLKGWTSGSNSLQLELLDGRGKPLNPPFNSLVSELVLKPSEPKPRWQLGRLSAEELASLVGQTPTPAAPRPTKPKAVAAPIAAPAPAPEPPPQPTIKPEPTPEPQAAEPEPAEPQPSEPEPAQSETEIFAPPSAEARGRESATPALEDSPGDNGDQTLLEDNPALALQSSEDKSSPKSGTSSERIDDDAADRPTVLTQGREEPAAELSNTNPDGLAKPEEPPNPEDLANPEDLPNPEDFPNPEELANGDDPAEPSASGDRDAVIPPPITNPDRLAPLTSVVGSARDQVHEDGSLIKPKRKGPLAGLRERLAP